MKALTSLRLAIAKILCPIHVPEIIEIDLTIDEPTVTEIDWATMAISADDLQFMSLIANRAIALGVGRAKMDLLMDLQATHSVTPLRLAELVEASDAELIHDVSGIAAHLDRETGDLRDCFLPRYAV